MKEAKILHNQAKTLHNQAMDLAEKAFSLEKQGALEEAVDVFKQAFELEKKAALMIPISEENEPSRSIMFRSAGTLAFHANLFKESERMIGQGFAGYPPAQIETELQGLYFKILLKDKESIIRQIADTTEQEKLLIDDLLIHQQSKDYKYSKGKIFNIPTFPFSLLITLVSTILAVVSVSFFELPLSISLIVAVGYSSLISFSFVKYLKKGKESPAIDNK